MLNKVTLAGGAAVLLAATAFSQDFYRPRRQPVERKTSFERVVDKVTSMLDYQSEAQRLARRHKLTIMSTAWEDNGRDKNSSMGSLISDLSIYVHIKGRGGKFERAQALPILRHQNFTDKTADISPGKFFIKVGNEKEGRREKFISLADYLAHLNRYLTKPGNFRGSLLSTRDTDFLVSAQASFIPVPEGKDAEVDFTPALYQYQSNDITVQQDEEDDEDGRGRRPVRERKTEKSPAVLTIIASREGTSATVIDNKRDQLEGQTTHGQPLFFNQAGLRAPFQAKRKSDFIANGGNPAEGGIAANGQTGMGMVMIIQVPLKHREPPRSPYYSGGLESVGGIAAAASPRSLGAAREEAVVGHGAPVGPFTELDGLNIERDERYPIRVTVQFYQAVQSGDLTEDDFEAMEAQIKSIYKNANAVGSLVTKGETGRVTEHSGPTWTPPYWYRPWWPVCRQRYGYDERSGVEALNAVYGDGWKYLAKSEADMDTMMKKVKEVRAKHEKGEQDDDENEESQE